jgi:tetrahydromethanopterin S-methyltransferase subunit G
MDNKDIYQVLVKHDERLKNIYSTLSRIEKHLDKVNGKVERHETGIAKMQVWGSVALITFPIVINTIMRLM